MTRKFKISDNIRTVSAVSAPAASEVKNECSTETFKSSLTSTTKLESEQFESNLSARNNRESLNELATVSTEPNDPLNSIDPLWSIRKELK